MSSPSPVPTASLRTPVGPEQGAVRRLLDATFGFLVWAVHLLVIYIVQALACSPGIGSARTQGRTGLPAVLGLVTLAAAAVVVLHALRRGRGRGRDATPERPFRVAVTVGCDAIAAVAILGQCLAIAMMPVCA